MDSVKKSWCIVLAVCLLAGLAGCAEHREMPTETQAVITTEETTAPTATSAETEATEVTEATVVTEPVILEEPEPVAEYISEGVLITLDGVDVTEQLAEADYDRAIPICSSQKLTIESETPFAALYIIWKNHPGIFTLQWDGGSLECGAEGFLHDYIRLPEAVCSVSFAFEGEEDYAVMQLGAYTYGTAPEGVQDWLPPCETADILAFPTHSDDDVLFFGGVISYYAIEEELTVQTAFMTDHRYEPFRNHERLNGLWEMGVRHYPIVGTARDFYTMSLQEAANYHGYDPILEWQVQQIRRFKPLVIIGHDPEGEYGHGQHQLNTYCLVQAVEMAADARDYPWIALQYGLWDTPKLYLHLYEENPIIFDVNTVLNNDPAGRTPYEIAQDAYVCHVSQAGYFEVSQNPNSVMDCTRFGLYRTLVGYDTGGDLMEHTARGE